MAATRTDAVGQTDIVVVDGRPTLAGLRDIVRHCYMVIAANTIWLFIPLFGLLTGNKIERIFEMLVVAGFVLFVSNNYLGKRWYYNSEYAKGTAYEGHFDNIDYIGFRTFFVTLLGSLTFLIMAVFLSEALKSYAGRIVNVLDIILSALFTGLAIWILRRALKGLMLATKSQPFA